ncbi:MAG: site-2 protease family protein [Kofleriaceae bacterium]|nr:site-2 protease family protein [Kofleriaceae bacterium]MCL4223074.1 site-2 protease family protein [Myxococcales bacterium]
MSALTILGAIFGLGFLIVVHEAGHFVVARLCGMRVERFSIGFGPGLLRWRSKKGTLFQLAPIPFGGFVEIKGMAIHEDVEADDHHAYPNRPVWQRIATIFAGPGTNFLAAIVLAFFLFAVAGVRSSVEYYGVDKLNPGFDAAAKLEPGDRLLAINGEPVYLRGPDGQKTELCVATAKLQGGVANLTILRGGQQLEVAVAPKFDEMKDEEPPSPGSSTPPECVGPRWRLGIDGWQIQADRIDVGVAAAFGHALWYPVRQTRDYFAGIYKVIKGKEQAEVLGPVGMTSIIKKSIETGWVSMIQLLMLLNVLLAIVNLFPLPGLDGGRLAFLGYELVTRRRANPKVETTVHMVGILLLMVVLVLVTVKDCRGLF